MEVVYKDSEYWLDAVTEYLASNLDLVRSGLASIPEVVLIEPEGTFLLWLDFRNLGLPEKGLAHFLKSKAGWAITRGPTFGNAGIDFARLNIACPASKLEAALVQLADAVSQLDQAGPDRP